jgi:ubiquinone/menaquinone biosynthesis C-methylase UbiE
VLCVTVLQYIRYPFVAMREAYRVLKPGGRIIGTVAFLEPSHGRSYYHHTNLGTFNSLYQAGFKIDILAPSQEWTVFKALAHMGLFHGMPKSVSEIIVLPLESLHKLWWWAGSQLTHRDLEEVRTRNFTGSYTFIATKEEARVGGKAPEE